MEELRDLQEIYDLAASRFNQYDGKDFVLPQIFKNQVKEINNSTITYNEYSAIIETKGNQYGVLNIYLPNQWFYIASYFTDLYKELQKYKKEALKVVTKERLKELNGALLTDQEKAHVQNLPLNEMSKSYLIKFMTDYSWWNGAKTIDRGDFYVSPILNSAKLVNVSQSYIADLCAFLADKDDLVRAIINKGNVGDKYSKKELLREPAAATFMRKAMRITLDKDENLKLLSALHKYKNTQFQLQINGFNLGRFKDKLPTRLTDVDLNVEWEYNAQKYVLYLEWNQESLEKKFFPVFNEAYRGKLQMQKENGEYILYELSNKNGSKKLQQIFYGAPGTGKSFKIKGDTEKAEEAGRVIRTTFHPDSDYSTFVGAYKPSMDKEKKHVRMNMSLEDLAKELSGYYNDNKLGKIGGVQKFCLDYHEFIDGEIMSVNVNKLLELAGIPEAYNVEVNKYVKFCQLLPKQDRGKIIYAFIPQAFTNAYVKAWNTEEDVYLIIEEINRGNCAQIFGDLFQLLDRKNGFSEYPVDADTDLADYLSNALAQSPRTDFPDGVKEGKKLVLPSNLYIWATMNTSDQSLFPIDSAFKRRWDWVYIPIKNHEDKNYVIDIDGSRYNWWGFLEKINAVIGDTTSSEDKKLGYFFVKADEGIIKEDKFVSKVLFYLWNDVFKNYGFDNAIFSRGENKKFAFSDFFQNDGSPDTSVVNEFLVKLDTTINKEKSFVDEASDGSPSSFMVKYNGEDIEGPSARGKYIALMKRIVSDMGGEQVSKCIGAHLTKEPDLSSTRNFIPVDSEWYLVTNAGIDLMKGNVRKLKESLGIDVVLE